MAWLKAILPLVGVLTLSLTVSASSLWDLTTSSPRPRRTTRRQPTVVERGYVAMPPPTSVVYRVEKVEVVKPVTSVVEKVVERLVEVEKPVTNVVEKVVEVEKPVEVRVEVEKPVTNIVEKVVEVEKPVEVRVEVEKPVTNIVEKVVEVEKPVEVRVEVEKPVTNIVEKVVEIEKPVTTVVEKVVERIVEIEKPVTSVVEKVVYDRSEEYRLAHDKEELQRRGAELADKNTGLENANAALRKDLQSERTRRERLERQLNPKGGTVAKTGRPARITSENTYYDRKRGVAYFDGHVYVDDESYQLHADRAYVFTNGSNDVRRIVAVGHVAMTNEFRRAYGGKVSYYRQDGMVVLYAGDGVNAEVRDESKAEDQSVCGSRIKFWIDNEQVEVMDATIVAPRSGGAGGLGLPGGK